MAGIKETFDEYAKMAEQEVNENQQGHATNSDPTSHLRSGGLFDRKGYKPVGQIELAMEGEDIGEGMSLPKRRSEDEIKRSMKKQTRLAQMVQDSLVNFVEAPTGVHLMKVGWEEHLRIRKDPDFEPFSKYSFNILNYTDGRPRERPLRPFVSNEIGMYRGKIVVLDRMPDESSRGDTPYVQVGVDLGTNDETGKVTYQDGKILAVEKDPFPTEGAKLAEAAIAASEGVMRRTITEYTETTGPLFVIEDAKVK